MILNNMEIIFKSFWAYFGSLFFVLTCGYALGIPFYLFGIGLAKYFSIKKESNSVKSNFFSQRREN